MNTWLEFRWNFVMLTIPLVFVFTLPGFCDEPTITVTGEAAISVLPDEVVILTGIESRAKTVPAATKDNDAKIQVIQDFLKKSGLEEKAYRAEYLTIQPIFPETRGYSAKGENQGNNQGPQGDDPFAANSELTAPEPIGYLAIRQFAITISDLKKVELIYTGLIERGVSRSPSIDLRTSRRKKLQEQLRLDAVRATKEKAQAMAGELGAKLASIKTMRDTTGSGEYSRREMPGMNSHDPFGNGPHAGPTSASGQITFSSSVEIVFVLGDAELKK